MFFGHHIIFLSELYTGMYTPEMGIYFRYTFKLLAEVLKWEQNYPDPEMEDVKCDSAIITGVSLIANYTSSAYRWWNVDHWAIHV